MKVFIFLSILLMLVKADDHDPQQTDRRNRILERHPRDVTGPRVGSWSVFGRAVSFSGRHEFIRLKLANDKGYESSDVSDDVTEGFNLPNKAFTVMFWVKPEGGQYRYTPIIDVFDECKRSSKNGWTVGIKLPSNKRENARFVFSVRQEGSSRSAHLLAHKAYDHNTWSHVGVTFDGNDMRMYVNGAKMSKQTDRDAVIFRKAFIKCVGLYIGGLPDENVFFRGKVDELGIWSRVLEHVEIVDYMNKAAKQFKKEASLIVAESFSDLKKWEVRSDVTPGIVTSDIVLPYHTVRLEAPRCGRTICDDPEVVLSYVNNTQLLNKKRLRYRVVNIMNSDGSNSLMSEKAIFEQHKALSKVFEPYDIYLDLEQVDVANTTLLEKVIMFDCSPSKIGNGNCDEECAHSTTGNDAGDCDRVKSECSVELLGNGFCNPECNKAYHKYDDGDCCLPGEHAHAHCIDPGHLLRGYMHIDEVKMDLQIDGHDAINVFVITSSWNRASFRGLSTYPWEKNVYTSMGGIIMHADVFGKAGMLKTLVHEFGHNLGLWHVHHGVSEMSCDDSCMETHPSMVLGDLCSDTNPTNRNSRCSDPLPSNSDVTCGQHSFRDTPYSNYMGYADDTCIDHFTTQQVARMHCYLDLVYQPMRDMKEAPPVPVSPKVIQADVSSVHLVWLEPLGVDSGCHDNNALRQYASTAVSSHSGVRWSPNEATGFPDAERCTSSPYTWKPYHSDTPPACDEQSCWIELGFQKAVIPRRLSIWVSEMRRDQDLYVELLTPDGDVIKVGDVPAFCDMETTAIIETDSYVNRVKIVTDDDHVAIDAVEIVSIPNVASCVNRKVPKYRLIRDPPIPGGDVVTSETFHVDSTVETGVAYTYTIEVTMDSRVSVLSPELHYTHGAAFCGDGMVDSNEACDDKNAVDGDGCTMDCKLEEEFTCKGSPSLCSVVAREQGKCDNSDGKGRCELSAPDGFVDQWALEATANPQYQSVECPASWVTGKPDQMQTCTSQPEGDFWRPCGAKLDVNGLFWIQVSIYKPVLATSVLVHLASDGRTVEDPQPKHLYIELLTADGTYLSVGTGVSASCEDNPVHIPILQDLSQPFVLSKGVRISFTSSSISIYAVRVRSSPYINPVEMASCDKKQLYNTGSGLCVRNTCMKVTCSEFPVKYGETACSGLEDGDTCKITCDKGYQLQGHDNKAVCVDGSWVTTSPLFCAPVECGKPTISMATVSCPDGTTFSKECVFKCDRPAFLNGDETSITCLRNGRWSKPKSTCEVQCRALSIREYKHGKLKTSSCTKGHQPVGQQCKVRCHERYHAEGARNNKRKFLRIVCGVNGEWFGPHCVPDTCSPLPAMFDGAYLCTRDFNVGSTCTMSCPGDQPDVQSVTCTGDSVWNRQFDVCPSDALKTCPVLTSAHDVTYDCTSRTPGGICKVGCAHDGQEPFLKRQKSELESPRDMKFVPIDQVVCTVLGSWGPGPEHIQCILGCIDLSIGDGFCDLDNNRDLCSWDGGDCCPSTVPGGEVFPFPDDCTTGCECKDPTADENRRKPTNG